jgi:hypothetical protein
LSEINRAAASLELEYGICGTGEPIIIAFLSIDGKTDETTSCLA